MTGLMGHLVRQHVKSAGAVEAQRLHERKRKQTEMDTQNVPTGSSKRASQMQTAAGNVRVGGAAGGDLPVETLAKDTENPVAKDEQKANVDKMLESLQLRYAEATVGAGGWGCVFKVYHNSNPAIKVAFKMSQMWVNGDVKRHCDVTQLLKEYQYLSLCTPIAQCSQLVKVSHFQTGLASRVVEGKPEYLGLFTQWIPSVSLAEAAREDAWWTGDALECIKSLVKGVLAMHELLLIHNDIKPDNVMISPDRRSVRIIDFGLSTMIQVGMEKYGTPGYRAQEFATATAALSG